MKYQKIKTIQGVEIARKVLVCNGFLSRCRGLLFRPNFPKGDACWLMPCSNIHTWGMTFPIDVLVLDKENKVIARKNGLRPWRFSPYFSKARSILEFRSPMPEICNPGDQLVFEDVNP